MFRLVPSSRILVGASWRRYMILDVSFVDDFHKSCARAHLYGGSIKCEMVWGSILMDEIGESIADKFSVGLCQGICHVETAFMGEDLSCYIRAQQSYHCPDSIG